MALYYFVTPWLAKVHCPRVGDARNPRSISSLFANNMPTHGANLVYSSMDSASRPPFLKPLAWDIPGVSLPFWPHPHGSSVPSLPSPIDTHTVSLWWTASFTGQISRFASPPSSPLYLIQLSCHGYFLESGQPPRRILNVLQQSLSMEPQLMFVVAFHRHNSDHIFQATANMYTIT